MAAAFSDNGPAPVSAAARPLPPSWMIARDFGGAPMPPVTTPAPVVEALHASPMSVTALELEVAPEPATASPGPADNFLARYLRVLPIPEL